MAIARIENDKEAMEERLNQLEGTLIQVGKEPRFHAQVIQITEKPARPEDFIVGMTVMYTDSYSGDRKTGRGRIVEVLDNEYARVLFASGQSTLRIGNKRIEKGALDIKPAGFTTGSTTISMDGRRVEIEIPAGVNIQVGSTVLVKTDTLQILEVTDSQPLGSVCVITKVIDTFSAEIDHQGSTRVIAHSHVLEEGDRVIVDGAGHCVLKNLGQPEESFTAVHETPVTWEDIGGQEEAKEILQEAILGNIVNADLYKTYGKKPIRGILLWGPAGVGKTMLGKASATALAQGHKVTTSGFIYVKGPEVLSKWVGEAEKSIRDLFKRARRHQKTHGFPAVIFIDEAESLLSRRGSGQSSDIDKTVVATFLAEMDGMNEEHPLVILATNRQDVLDSAVMRPGRMDRHVRVSRPDISVMPELFNLYLSRVPLEEKVSARGLSEIATSEFFDPSKILAEVKLKEGKPLNLLLCHLASGALVNHIVDQSTSIAIKRDKAAGFTSGIGLKDVKDAINLVYKQQKSMDHWEIAEEIAGVEKNSILSVTRTG